MSITLKSTEFRDGDPIPARFTGEGENVSPPFQWSGVPSEAKELVLICEDPDAPQPEPFVHWLIYGIPPDVSSLPATVPPAEQLSRPIPAKQGRNSFGKVGYRGPLPPIGHGTHHYVFRLYALRRELGLPPGIEKDELQRAMRSHILDSAQLIGTFRREKHRRREAA